MQRNIVAAMAAALTPAQAAEANLTVGDVVEAKLDELAELYRTAVPDTVIEQRHADWLMQEVAHGFPAAVLAGLIALVPRIDAGETGRAFGDRLAEVPRG